MLRQYRRSGETSGYPTVLLKIFEMVSWSILVA